VHPRVCVSYQAPSHLFPSFSSCCCSHTTDFGQEKAVSVQGLDAAAVQNKLKELIKAGESMPK
jgi:hypothetical protein